MNTQYAILASTSVVLACMASINLIVLVASLRGYRLRELMRCGGCGYDVSGLRELRCPECGSALRQVGIPSSGLQRGFSTVFIALLLLGVSGNLLWGTAMTTRILVDAHWPRSVRIQDGYSSLRFDRNFIPILDGDKAGDRKRSIHIIVERVPNDRAGGSMSETMYPGIEDRAGMLLIMRGWGGVGDSSGTGNRPPNTLIRDQPIDASLRNSTNVSMSGQIGQALIIPNENAITEEQVKDWIVSHGLDWTAPEKPRTGYQADESPESNVARVLMNKITGMFSSTRASTSTPFSGASSGSFRTIGQARVDRASWVNQSYLWGVNVISVLIAGIVLVWAVRRR